MSGATDDFEDMIAQERKKLSPQPPTDTDDLAAAIQEFETALPGWWWSVCVCSRTRDASCGPDLVGPDAHLLKYKIFDEGFHRDDPNGTLASSLRDVMKQALEAKAAVRPFMGDGR